MAFYGSTDWLNLFKDSINSDKEFKKASSRFSASMLIVTNIQGLPRPVYVWMDVHEGTMREWAYVAEPSERKAEFTFTSDYFTWKAICQAELDVIKAVVTGRIKLAGNKLKLLKQTKSSLALLGVMKKLDTQFPDDVFQKQA